MIGDTSNQQSRRLTSSLGDNDRQTPSLRQSVPARALASLSHVLLGYMRVSTAGDRQTVDLQREALVAAGVDHRHFYTDKASGAPR
jgi:hypothetical protein